MPNIHHRRHITAAAKDRIAVRELPTGGAEALAPLAADVEELAGDVAELLGEVAVVVGGTIVAVGGTVNVLGP